MGDLVATSASTLGRRRWEGDVLGMEHNSKTEA